MEWLVFTGAVIWLSGTAALWLRLSALDRRMRELRDELDSLRPGTATGSGDPMPESPGPAAPLLFARTGLVSAGAVPAGLNFSRRVQVLRLHRRGESFSNIAAMVGVTPAEAELTIKLHAQGLSVVSET